MTVSFSLPPGCTIRPARLADRDPLQHLLHQFRQEVLPPVTQTEWTMRILAGGLLGGITLHLTFAMGWQRVMQLLLGPGIFVGLGLLTATVLTWNDQWKNFWVIEHDQQLVACAKLRRYETYSLLHDVYVSPEWRSQGIGSHLVAHIGNQAQKPLYLTCLPKLAQFYFRLGFTPIATKTLPPLIKYDLGIPGRLDVMPLVLR